MERRWLAVVIFTLGAGAVTPAGAQDAFRCELTDASGVSEADARTAVRVLCDQLRQASGGRGASASPWGRSGRPSS